MKNVSKVQNPLTIIAIFAGIAEITGTAVLLGLPLEIQKIFVWFVMIFPFALVGGFVFILYKNSLVLYAPSDYENEDNFVSMMKIKLAPLNEAEKSIETVKKIVEAAHEEEIQPDVKEKVSNYLEDINKQIATTQSSMMSELRGSWFVRVNLDEKQKEIIELLKEAGKQGLTLNELSNGINTHFGVAHMHVSSLIDKGMVTKKYDKFILSVYEGYF